MGLNTQISLGTKAILAQAAAWAATPVGIITIIAVSAWGLKKAYDALTTSVEEHKQMLEDAKSSYSDTASSIDDLNSKLSETQTKIEELSGYDKLSFTDEQELESLKRQNDELQREIDLQKQLSDSKQQDVNRQFADTMAADIGRTGEYQSSFYNEFTGNTGGVAIYRAKQINEMQYAQEQVSAYKYAIKDYKNAQSELNSAIESGDKKAQESAQKQVELYKGKADSASEYLNNFISAIAASAEGVTEDESTKPYLSFIENLRDNWAITYSEMSGSAEDWATSQTDAFKRVSSSEEFSKISSSAKKLGDNLDLTEEKYGDFLKALVSSGFIADTSSESLKKVADAISGIGESSASSSDVTKVAIKSYSDLISELSGKFDVITSAQDELSQSGVLSYSTVQKLLEAYPNFQSQLTLTKNGFVTTKSALDDLISAQIEEYKISNDNAVSAANELINSETAKQIGYKSTTASIYDQISAMQKLAAAQLAMAGSDFVQKRLSEGDTLSEISRNQNYQDMVTSANQAYMKISGVYDNLFNSKSNLDNAKDLASSIKAGNTTKSKSSTDIYVADINKLADAEQKLKNVQNELSQQQIFRDLSDSYSESIASIQKEISLYKQEQIAIKELNAERTKQIQENVSNLQAQGFSVAYNASSNRLAITNMEHINQIVGKTTEETNNLRKAAESLIDTTQTLNDDNIKGTQDWYSSLKSIKSEYEELQSVVSNTVEKAFSKVSDLLNDEKEAYEKQKSNLESVANTVTSYINDYISGLQEQNDELEKQISLQEKLEALDKAKTQRNKRVFRAGVGFQWEADESAVNSAQEDYDSAKREYDLDTRIKELQDYADAWKNAVDAYQNAIDQNLTNTILGTNWRSDALNMDYDSVYGFQRQYSDVLGELDEDVYGSVAYQIKNLDLLKKRWDDSVDEANSTGTDYQSVLDLISTYESGSYSTRLTALSDFVSSAISQYQALANAAAASANMTATAVKTVGSSGGGSGHSGGITVGDILNGVGGLGFKDGYDPYGGDNDSGGSSSSSGSSGGDGFGGYGDPSDYVTNWDDIKGYSNGGVADYTGVAMLHGAQGAEMILNNTDVSKLYDYIHSGDVLAQSAANMLVSSNLSVLSSATPNSGQSQSFTMGDIKVYGVNDVDGLVNAIKTEFPSKMMQSFYKKR